MTTRRTEPGGSWWYGATSDGAEQSPPAGGENFTYQELCDSERRHREQLAAIGGYQLQQVQMAAPQNQQQVVDADIFQLSYPRPRLRWTAELHDQFVKAVDQLGGANKATPKAIWNLMGVQGLTLYHLKSHLQKFRLGKTGRRLLRKEFIPSNYYRKDNTNRLPPMNMEAQAPSFSNAFDGTSIAHEYGGNILGAETYGNMHLLVDQPQPAVENFEMTSKIPALNTSEVAAFSATTAAPSTTSVKLEEEFGAVTPALLPLFPPIPKYGMMDYSAEWSEYPLEGGGGGGGGGRRSVGQPSRPVENPSMDDYYNSLGYSSSESCRASMVVGTFFDEVASFPKVDPDLAAAEAGLVSAVEPHDHLSAESVAHFYP